MAALQVEALQRLESPEAADGWDEQLAVACDTLAGATFAWTSPPQVTAVLPGSLADGVVSKGCGGDIGSVLKDIYRSIFCMDLFQVGAILI